ncbi:DUF4327 family protein [Crocosphaera chwakensis]|uniref:DUF4327 domain-containing protein n=1 Tax=Crocosphaera chwakensis CCY0110 TaxID=391612 RepID=A3IK70_9CHRO|nr:DUF4327 family protein [Crocosphaera chwakensis]EAZ93059.1 hypothetical protein CY0110_03284 [Crocosphaera chwakensis CCY0110]
MNLSTQFPVSFSRYSIDFIQQEARHLVDRGLISRQQPISSLCDYIPPREWIWVEHELEKFEYLLRDRISDLISSETWSND